ncbi:ELWxxDGT repeat protein [Melittangium boletus]|uniref:HYR domain-containing protein n=1 Tax=Melittangium boletus DSM 14713 TaxID=1294270 RepID=A0A250ICG5_9BACT|nr:ELWxxDGT repeat protein [Melittangium boletus]ATB29455.1 HYR domain-containing protein [Melittangium boletus DSM 14713]
MDIKRGARAGLALTLAVCVGCGEPVEGEAERLESVTAAARQDALTSGEPVLVKDLHPGQYPPWLPVGSQSREFARAGHQVFFAVGDVETTALWVSDGTAVGTRRVWDFNPFLRGSYVLLEGPSIQRILSVGGLVSVVVNAGLYPEVSEVWRSDGTPEGTWPLSSHARLSEPVLGAVGDTFFFAGDEGVGGTPALWKSDGSRTGTVRVKTLPIHVTALRAVGSTLFIASGSELWKSDGTDAGTSWVATLAAPGSLSSLTAVGSTLFFVSGGELWKSDGTKAGTVRIIDLKEAPSFSAPQNLTALGSTLVFSATDAEGGRELWKSDGTGAGTVRVKDLAPGAAGSEPSVPAVMGGALYFLAHEGSTGRELWTSDGTAEGTVRLTDRVSGPADSFSGRVVSTDHRLFLFSRDDERTLSPYSLWMSDGVEAPVPLASSQDFTGALEPSDFAVLGDTLLFSVLNPYYARVPWVSDGTPEGSHVLMEAWEPGNDSEPRPWVDLDGTLLFTRGDELNPTPYALWRSNGTERGTTYVAGPFASEPQAPVRLGTRVFFSVSTPASGKELWRTDGTPAGTSLVRDLVPGPGSSEPGPGVVLGERLVFSAATASHGIELWSSDGTSEGTVLLKDIWPGAFSSAPGPLVKVGGLAYFSAHDGVHGVELWRTDGTPEGTLLVADVAPGAKDFSPSSLHDVNGTLAFVARDPAAPGTPSALWRLDATGTPRKVSSVAPMSTHWDWMAVADGTLFYSVNAGSIEHAGEPPPEIWKYGGGASSATRVSRGGFHFGLEPVAAGGTVFFTARSPGRGRELWSTDATGTRRVKSFLPGPTGGGMGPYGMVALEGLGKVMFRASDGEHGLEPWISDGTEAGTWRVGDLAPGPMSSNPTSFVRSGSRIFFGANDGPHGQELWMLPLPSSGDLPPQVTCPADVVEELSGPLTPVTWPHATVIDEDVASSELTYTPALGSLFPLGATRVTARVMDAAGQAASCSFGVTVRDTTPPTLTCPPTTYVEATSASGGQAFFESPRSWDVSGGWGMSYQGPGQLYPLGTRTFIAQAWDESGNTSSCTYDVVVRDTTPPTLKCPAAVTVEASEAGGAFVGYAAATASDTVSAVTVTYSQASGSRFPLGTTLVTATARDAAGNTSSCSIPVTVRDTRPPLVLCGGGAHAVEATSASGALVSSLPVSASDTVSAVTLTYSPALGTLFPLGTTEVTATARDAAGNTSTCSLALTVRDTTAPLLTCPADLLLEATSASGALADFAAHASDTVTLAPALLYSQAPGTRFPVGDTQVTVRARDEAGVLSAPCSFLVSVRDTTPPTLSCPARVTAEATSPTGALVTYAPATASDTVSAATVSYGQASGTRFPLGTTPVMVWARDASGNRASCAFEVEVRDTTAPVLTCPSAIEVEALSTVGGPADFSVGATDAVTDSGLLLTYSHAPGSVFAFGTTPVTVSAQDAAGNTGTCSFSVTVRDTLAPTLTCPESQVLDATQPEGAPAFFSAKASDVVSARLVPTYSHASGALFPVGRTRVNASVVDRAGNASACFFFITVRDTRASR